jgi:hypothetical protein
VDKIEDQFSEVLAATTGQIVGKPDNGVRLKASVYASEFRDTDEYDFASFPINPQWDQKIGV